MKGLISVNSLLNSCDKCTLNDICINNAIIFYNLTHFLLFVDIMNKFCFCVNVHF